MRDQYELVRELGRGQSGVVHQARHKHLPRVVAVKLILKSALTEPGALLDEAHKMAALPDHDNVVKVWDAGEWDDDAVAIVSEYCPGGSLEQLSQSAPVDPAAAANLISETCRGLDHVHQSGLLHLDVRPANVLIDEHRRPKLADFGLARWTHDAATDDWYWPHAAPELIESGAGEERTDVYAMAMTLAHLLTSGAICRPFLQGAELVLASCNGEWPRLAELGENVPTRLKKLIAASTAYNTSMRPGSAHEFKRLLDKATPAISFGAATDGEWRSVDGAWRIHAFEKKKAMAVDVRKGNRRQTSLCLDGLSPLKASRHVQHVVDHLASR